MTSIEVLELVQEYIPNFDGGNEGDIIKAGKLLNAQSKFDQNININDIEIFFSFFYQYGSKFAFLLNDRNVKAILKNDVDSFTGFPSDYFNNKNLEITTSFAEIFAEEIHNFIFKCLKNKLYHKLKDLMDFYEPIITLSTLEKLKKQISNSNRNILEIINDTSKYKFFETHLSYAISPSYYRFQSQLDSYYFENQILDIAFQANEKKTDRFKKQYYVGKILVAISSFNSFSEETNNYLQENLKTGNFLINSHQEHKNSFYIILFFFIPLILILVLTRLFDFRLSKNYSTFLLFILFISTRIFSYFKQKNNFHK